MLISGAMAERPWKNENALGGVKIATSVEGDKADFEGETHSLQWGKRVQGYFLKSLYWILGSVFSF